MATIGPAYAPACGPMVRCPAERVARDPADVYVRKHGLLTFTRPEAHRREAEGAAFAVAPHRYASRTTASGREVQWPGLRFS